VPVTRQLASFYLGPARTKLLVLYRQRARLRLDHRYSFTDAKMGHAAQP